MKKPVALGIIPARYGSTRFPGKPLAEIAGKPMIQRVYEQAMMSDLAHVVIATDDDRIFRAAEGFGAAVVMTSDDHQSGTDRCSEALDKIQGTFDVVVNIQGDEPFIQPAQINLLVSCFENPETRIATLVKKITSPIDLFDRNRVKALLNKHGKAIYFSRTPLPSLGDLPQDKWLSRQTFYGHIGMYAFRPEVLKALSALPPSPLEQAESLEQLRWIENGFDIHVAETEMSSDSVDHPDDLRKMNERYRAGGYNY